jgi:hypothetical protein
MGISPMYAWFVQTRLAPIQGLLPLSSIRTLSHFAQTFVHHLEHEGETAPPLSKDKEEPVAKADSMNVV